MQEEKKSVSDKFINLDTSIKIIVGVALISIFSWIFLLCKAINASVSASDARIDILGKMGDSFNIGTSLFSAITICLIAYTIFQQKEEFKKIITHNKDEERTNRAIKLYEEWLLIKERQISIEEKSFNDILNKFHKERIFAIRIAKMNGNSFKDKIDFQLLFNQMGDETITSLEIALLGLSSYKSEVSEKIKKINSDKKNYPPNFQNQLKTSEEDEKTLYGYNENMKYFQYSIDLLKSAVKSYED